MRLYREQAADLETGRGRRPNRAARRLAICAIYVWMLAETRGQRQTHPPDFSNSLGAWPSVIVVPQGLTEPRNGLKVRVSPVQELEGPVARDE